MFNRKVSDKKYRDKNKESISKKQKEYMKEYNKQYWSKNKKILLDNKKEWLTKNKEYHAEYDKNYYIKNNNRLKKQRKEQYNKDKQYIRDYKLSNGCAICGYNKYADVLDFHHEGDKEFNISLQRNINKIKEEMKKCIILCSNCHRELHAKRRIMEGE
jgi:hypothetical protein